MNYTEDVYRQRFTAAHEAGHAILDDGNDVNISFTTWDKGNLSEVRANTFASHYLLPHEFLRGIPDPRQWSSEKALHWASRLKVSATALSFALRDAALINENVANRTLRNDAADGLTTYGYDAANQLLTGLRSGGTTTYTYDAAGNRLLRIEPGVGITTYTWDFSDRLIGMNDPVTGVSTNVYNAVGLRMQIQSIGGATKFVFDMQNLLLETDAAGITQVGYTVSNSAGKFGDYISQRQSGSTKFYAFDALGSTDSLVDSGGSVRDRYVYSAFGLLVTSPQPDEDRHTYVGRLGYKDDFGHGVYYCVARWYEADTGRWLSRDPKGFDAGDNNLYRYVFNNPTRLTDANGTDCPGCDIPNWALGGQLNSSDCVLACCAQHDKCYFDNGCTAKSWAWNVCSPWFGFLSNCAACNNRVVACIAACAFGNHMAGQPLFFCANKKNPHGGQFITIGLPSPPNDFPNTAAAKKACCT